MVYIKQKILRRPSKHQSPRPFQRIIQDLFNFKDQGSYNRYNQLLLIKDEFSRKLYGYILANKTEIEVLRIIRNFKYFVARQYRLLIYKIKHNNNTLIITVFQGLIEYKKQVEAQGIELKLSLIYTYKNNGSIKYIEQEVIT